MWVSNSNECFSPLVRRLSIQLIWLLLYRTLFLHTTLTVCLSNHYKNVLFPPFTVRMFVLFHPSVLVCPSFSCFLALRNTLVFQQYICSTDYHVKFTFNYVNKMEKFPTKLIDNENIKEGVSHSPPHSRLFQKRLCKNWFLRSSRYLKYFKGF